MLVVDRRLVRRRPNALDAAALVDRYIHDDASGPHPRHHLVRHHRRRLRRRDQHGPDEQVGVGHAALKVGEVGHERHDPPAILGVERLKFARVEVEDGHPSAHARRHLDRVRPGIAGADDDDMPGERARDPAQEDTRAAVLGLQEIGSHLDREAPGDLGHRLQEGERAVDSLDGLVGDPKDLLLEKDLRQGRTRGEVKVGEQGLALLEKAVLLAQGLLDLEYHVRRLPDRRRVGDEDPRPRPYTRRP